MQSSRSAVCSLISRRDHRSAITCVRRQYPVLEWGSNSSRVGLGLVNQSKKVVVSCLTWSSCHLSRSAMCSLIARRYCRSAVTCVRQQYSVLEWGSNSSRVGLVLVNQSWNAISEITAISAWQIGTRPSGNRHSISLTLETNKRTSSWFLVALPSQNMDKSQFRVRTFWIFKNWHIYIRYLISFEESQM